MSVAQKMSRLSSFLPEWNLSPEMKKAQEGVPLKFSSIFTQTPMDFLLGERGLDAKTLHQYFKFSPVYDGSILKFVLSFFLMSSFPFPWWSCHSLTFSRQVCLLHWTQWWYVLLFTWWMVWEKAEWWAQGTRTTSYLRPSLSSSSEKENWWSCTHKRMHSTICWRRLCSISKSQCGERSPPRFFPSLSL